MRGTGDATSSDYHAVLASSGDGHWWSRGMRSIAWALLGASDGRLLDAGCGPGWLLADLPSHTTGFGVDRCRQTFVAGPVALADIARLPFAAGTFDVVTALDVLEQQGVSAGEAMASMARVLRPNGRLLVRVPAHPWLFGARDRYWGGTRRFRRSDLEALVRANGLRILRLTYANGFLFPVLVLARRLGLLERSGGSELRPLPGPINAFLAMVLRLEGRWLAKHDLPMGLSLMCLAEVPCQPS